MGKRIAIISSEYMPYIFGGLGTHVSNYVKFISRRIKVDLFIPKRRKYRQIPSRVVQKLIPSPEGLSHYEYWTKFNEALMLSNHFQGEGSYRLVHCHDWMTILSGIYLKWKYNIPLVFNIHLPQPDGFSRVIEEIGIEASDLVIVNSKSVKQELAKRKITKRDVRVIPNGIDVGIFNTSKIIRSKDEFILFVGRMVPQKGIDILLKGFSTVLRRHPNLRLRIVGDGSMRLLFRRVVRYLGIPNRVEFYGWINEQKLVAHYQQAKLCVIPSYFEPFGIVALEALACGCPAIVSEVGGLSEIIRNGREGFTFPVGKYLVLASLISKVLSNNELRNKLGRQARERAKQYNWRHITDMYYKEYKRIKYRKINIYEIIRSLEYANKNQSGDLLCGLLNILNHELER